MKIDLIKELFANVLGRSVADIQEEDTIETIPEWDSITHMQLITEIEAKFDLFLEGDEIAEMTSVKNIVELIEKKKS